MKLSFFVSLTATFILLFSCNTKTTIPGDTRFNSKRKAAGLPPLPLGWSFAEDGPATHRWFLPMERPVPPYTFYEKRLQLDHERVVKEENIFKGGSYVSGSETRNEQLTVGAYFNETGEVIDWDITYSGASADSLRLRKVEADSILGSWKISLR